MDYDATIDRRARTLAEFGHKGTKTEFVRHEARPFVAKYKPNFDGSGAQLMSSKPVKREFASVAALMEETIERYYDELSFYGSQGVRGNLLGAVAMGSTIVEVATRWIDECQAAPRRAEKIANQIFTRGAEHYGRLATNREPQNPAQIHEAQNHALHELYALAHRIGCYRMKIVA